MDRERASLGSTRVGSASKDGKPGSAGRSSKSRSAGFTRNLSSRIQPSINSNCSNHHSGPVSRNGPHHNNPPPNPSSVNSPKRSF